MSATDKKEDSKATPYPANLYNVEKNKCSFPEIDELVREDETSQYPIHEDDELTRNEPFFVHDEDYIPAKLPEGKSFSEVLNGVDDETLMGAEETVIENHEEACRVLAKQMHDEDVERLIVIKEEWDTDKNYRDALIHEARLYLDEHDGHGPTPTLPGHVLVISGKYKRNG